MQDILYNYSGYRKQSRGMKRGASVPGGCAGRVHGVGKSFRRRRAGAPLRRRRSWTWTSDRVRRPVPDSGIYSFREGDAGVREREKKKRRWRDALSVKKRVRESARGRAFSDEEKPGSPLRSPRGHLEAAVETILERVAGVFDLGVRCFAGEIGKVVRELLSRRGHGYRPPSHGAHDGRTRWRKWPAGGGLIDRRRETRIEL